MLLLLQTRASCLVLMVSPMQLSNWALFECVQLGGVCNLQHGILGEQACVLWLFYTTARSMLLCFFCHRIPHSLALVHSNFVLGSYAIVARFRSNSHLHQFFLSFPLPHQLHTSITFASCKLSTHNTKML